MKTRIDPCFGQVWVTKFDYEVPVQEDEVEQRSVDLSHFVIVLTDTEGSVSQKFPTVQVVPLSDSLRYASGHDLIIPKDVNPVGFECMAEFWNLTTMLERNLKEYVGDITDAKTLRGLELLWRQAYGLPIDVDELNTLLIGPSGAIYMRDVREFQRQEHDATEYLREPVYALLAMLEKTKDAFVTQLSEEEDKALTRKIYSILGLVHEEVVVEHFAAESPSPETLMREAKRIEIFNRTVNWGLSAFLNYLVTEVRFEIIGQKAKDVVSISFSFFEPDTNFKTNTVEMLTINKFEVIDQVRCFNLQRKIVELIGSKDMEIVIELPVERLSVKHKCKL